MQKRAHFVGIKEALVNQYMTKTKDKKFTDEIFYFKSLIKKHKNLISKHQLDCALLWLDLKNLYFEGQFMKVLKLFSFCFLHYPIYSFLRFFLGMRNVTKNIYFQIS